MRCNSLAACPAVCSQMMDSSVMLRSPLHARLPGRRGPVRSDRRSIEALSEPADARRLPHRDPRHDQRWKDEEADGVLELGLEGRVQVGDQEKGAIRWTTRWALRC
jgi:hypothetical protein